MKRTQSTPDRQPTPPSEDAAATEPATLDTCKADYAAGKQAREAFDRGARRWYGGKGTGR